MTGQPTAHPPGTAESRVPNEPFWGACGVPGCDECWPLYNEANEPITGNFGERL